VSVTDTVLTPTASYNRINAIATAEDDGDVSDDASIEVTGLRKHFGSTQALDAMTFSVTPGRVTGFIGPNGAGKSTTMRVILGLDAADEGSARVCGKPYHRLRQPLRHVGSLLDADALHPSRTGRNHLLWLARSQRITTSRVDAVIELVGLGSAARRKAGGFSLGMRQRLGIAAAMLGDPPVLIMDEPFNGMDPEGIIWMRAVLRTLASEGRAILVSSHLMSELQGVADHVVVIGRGRVLADASVGALLAHASGDQVLVRTETPTEAAAVVRRAGAGATVIDANALTVSGLEAQRVVEALGQAGVLFSEVTAQRATLEDVYLQITGEQAQFRAGSSREARP
jgi:ABC-2 type transport system ATP-binding protein